MRNFANVSILISSNPSNLETELEKVVNDGGATATVEAEYGDVLVEGSRWTLAHHGPRSGNPAPCLYHNIEEDRPDARLDAIGLSHVDLDSLGGVLALMGRQPGPRSFWLVAAAVDVNGAHKLDGEMALPNGKVVGATEEEKIQLHAFWAWSEQNRLFPPRDGSVDFATAWVEAAEAQLKKILDGDPEALEAGRAHAANAKELNESSMTQTIGPVIVRTSESFVNHIYSTPSGDCYLAVVGYNIRTKAVTVSLADPIDGVSCREIVQELWGAEAGGHDGIAGGPRDREMTYEDAIEAAEALAAVIL